MIFLLVLILHTIIKFKTIFFFINFIRFFTINHYFFFKFINIHETFSKYYYIMIIINIGREFF